MTDRPILFSGPMVRALLDGRKTQTRRILPVDPSWELDPCRQAAADAGHYWFTSDPEMPGSHHVTPRFAKGDRLYVREAWSEVGSMDPGLFITRADYPECVPRHYENVPPAEQIKWRPGIHMPRARSRLTLTVTDVRVQRLQECSDADAEAEGCPECPQCHGIGWINSGPDGGWQCTAKGCGDAYVDQYARLWDQINGAGAWAANPWIVALTFSVEKRNIDA